MSWILSSWEDYNLRYGLLPYLLDTAVTKDAIMWTIDINVIMVFLPKWSEIRPIIIMVMTIWKHIIYRIVWKTTRRYIYITRTETRIMHEVFKYLCSENANFMASFSHYIPGCSSRCFPDYTVAFNIFCFVFYVNSEFPKGVM